MNNDNTSVSKGSLIKNMLIGLVLAAVALFFVILPAEFGIDVTGFGKLSGLTKMSANTTDDCNPTKTGVVTQAKQAAADKPFPQGIANLHDRPPTIRSFKVKLEPADEVEYKALLPAGEPIIYKWQVENNEEVYVDFHGDPTEGDFPEGYDQSYQKGEMVKSSGSFTATFTGHHGWYWLNFSENEIVINLEVTGYYESLEEIYRSNQLAPNH